MTDIPIIFSAPMVQALLAGRKTMTRRLAFNSRWFCACGWRGQPKAMKPNPSGSRTCPKCGGSGGLIMKTVPTSWHKVKAGDRLYVRERVAVHIGCRNFGEDDVVLYFADGSPDGTPAEAAGPWTPSIHMPRRLSRITLTVTDTKREPLQNISEADAIAEGIEPVDREGYPRGWKSYEHYPDGKPHPHAIAPNKSAVTSFRELWQWLHGHETWAQNPEIVAISFAVHQANVDALKVAP